MRYLHTVLTGLVTSLFAGESVFGFGQIASNSDSLTISLSTKEQIRVTKLQDIFLSRHHVTGDYIGGTGVCVYRNFGRNYQITAKGGNSRGEFELSNGYTESLEYSVYYNDGTSPKKLSAGIPLTGQINADNESDRCIAGDSGYLHVSVPARQINAAPAGYYSGSLTLLVSPE